MFAQRRISSAWFARMAAVCVVMSAALVLGLWSPWTAPAEAEQRAPRKGAGAQAQADKAKGGVGSIRGVVRYRGQAPKRTPIDRGTDPVCAQKPRLTEKVVVTDGKLRDVHVGLAMGSAGTHAAPSKPVVVDQQECMYVPRVVGLVAGQHLHVKNSDPTYHNVRGTKHEHTEWNLGQPAQAPDIMREDVGKAGEVLTLRCDIHPWMRGYAVVSDHPFFDVTAADGGFAIEKVPAGRYTIEAWHPELGRKKAQVTVRAGQAAEVEFAFP